MPKPSGWWSIGQTVISGAILTLVSYNAGARGDVVVGTVTAIAVGGIFGLGELLKQSTDELREHALELLRLNKDEDKA